jgi:hypothetical protein
MTRGTTGRRKIPKKFSIMGHEYKVILDKDLFDSDDAYGTAEPMKKTIRIQTPKKASLTPSQLKKYKEKMKREGKQIPNNLDTIDITNDDAVETFYHELVHIILDAMGEDKLYSDERFVSLFGRLLHQVDKTKIFE